MTEQEINKAFEGRWRIKQKNLPSDPKLYEQMKSLCRDFFETGILLAEKSVSGGSPAGSAISSRAQKFYLQVLSFKQYPEQLLHDFFSYWSEPNKSNTKMRYELQKTWDTSRRLATWARNDFNHYGTSKTTTQQQRISKLADILVG